ncbi:MAG TPA: lipid-binding SYLF domain-containing protein [Kofleriaceae bacterium]
MSFARITASVAVFVAGCALFAGCATAPSTNAEKQSLQQQADATLSAMIAREPNLRDVTHSSLAYAVFPSIGKGGVLVGGAYGKGILYEGGVATGFVSVEQASIGAQLGGQSFSELLVLRNPADVSALKSGKYSVGANLGVAVLNTGAEAHTNFDPNASVFVMPRGGLMVDVSVNGQRIKYQSFNA